MTRGGCVLLKASYTHTHTPYTQVRTGERHGELCAGEQEQILLYLFL